MADYAIHDTTLIGTSNIIRKKEGSSALIDPADYPKRINLMGMLEEKTIVSSPIADFSDGADDVPTSSVKVTIPPTLSGVSSVSETQTGRNLLSGDGGDIPKTSQGVIFSVSTGIYTVEATENKTGYPFALMAKFDLKKGTYTISLENVITGLQLRVINRNVSPSQTLATTGNNTSATFTISADITDISFEIAITASSISEGTYIIKPQLEVGSTAHAYEPYQTPTTYTASLGRTIYGGEVDIVNGSGSETFARIDLGTLNYTKRTGVGMQSNGISSLIQNPPDNYTKTTAIASDYTADTWQIVMNSGTSSGLFGVSGGYVCFSTTETDPSTFKASMNGKYLVFPLATPTDFTFTGQEINTMLGYNAFWSDDGDTEVTYRSSGTITPVVPTLISKTITQNGTYSAEDDNADGYDEVTVNVPTNRLWLLNPDVSDGMVDVSVTNNFKYFVPFLCKINNNNSGGNPNVGGRESFNGTSQAVIYRNGVDIGGFYVCNKIPTGKYSKLYVYVEVTASSSGSFQHANIMITSSLTFDQYGRPNNTIKDVILASNSNTSEEINAQTGVTINSTDPLLLSAQVVEVDISGISQDFYVGFWNCDRNISIRSIYCE